MSSYPIWDVKETKELIFELYGKEQLLKAEQSLNSALQRRDFAKFHYFEAFDRWDAHLKDIEKENPIHVVLNCADEIAMERRAQRMDELAAHIHSCVHSLHTIPDTMAHAIYYGLALNLSSPLKERQITASAVASRLDSDDSMRKVSDFFRLIYTVDSFIYISALNNHGKHRSMVRPATWFDMTGQALVPITLEFSEFSYDSIPYPRQEIKQILTFEYERISKSIVDCGIEMLILLRSRADLQRNA